MVNPGKDVSHNPDDAPCDVCGAFAAFSWYTCTLEMGFGEHNDKTLEQVHNANKSYLRWIVRKVRRDSATPRGRFRRFDMPVRSLSRSASTRRTAAPT